MHTSITKRFTFEAAHSIPGHTGKCKQLHGHSYILEVTITGPIAADGMIMDFSDLSTIVNTHIISVWDHQYLNELLPFITTAENLARHIFTTLTDVGLPVSRIRLHETAKCYAEVSA